MNCLNSCLTKVFEPDSTINIISYSHLETYPSELDKTKLPLKDINFYSGKNITRKIPSHLENRILKTNQTNNFKTQRNKKEINANTMKHNSVLSNCVNYTDRNLYSNTMTNKEYESLNDEKIKNNNKNDFSTSKISKINTLGNEDDYNRYTTNYRNKLISPLKKKINKEQMDSIESGIQYTSQLSLIEKSKIKNNLKLKKLYKYKLNFRKNRVLKEINNNKNNIQLADPIRKKITSLNPTLSDLRGVNNYDNINNNQQYKHRQVNSLITIKKLMNNISSKSMSRSYNFRLYSKINKYKNKNSKVPELKTSKKNSLMKKINLTIFNNEIINKLHKHNSFSLIKKNMAKKINNITIQIEDKAKRQKKSKHFYKSSANTLNIFNMNLKNSKMNKPAFIDKFLDFYKINSIAKGDKANTDRVKSNKSNICKGKKN